MFKALLDVIDVDAAAMQLLSKGFAVDKNGCQEGEIHVLHQDKMTLLGQLASHHMLNPTIEEDREWLESEISPFH